MGNAILSTIYSRLGQKDKAYNLFNNSFEPYELPHFKVLTETFGGKHPYFAIATRRL